MQEMTPEEKQQIINTLSEKGANRPCPRCNEKNFTLLDGYFNQSIIPIVTSNIVVGASIVPSVVVICNNCGYMSQHAIGVLGLMPQNENVT